MIRETYRKVHSFRRANGDTCELIITKQQEENQKVPTIVLSFDGTMKNAIELDTASVTELIDSLVAAELAPEAG